MKRVQIGDKFYRWRRGKLVEIPTEWVGWATTDQTIRQRQSKGPRKARRFTTVHHPGFPGGVWRTGLPEGSRTHERKRQIDEGLNEGE